MELADMLKITPLRAKKERKKPPCIVPVSYVSCLISLSTIQTVALGPGVLLLHSFGVGGTKPWGDGDFGVRYFFANRWRKVFLPGERTQPTCFEV